jgi:esterase/lipase superfamily enzyme
MSFFNDRPSTLKWTTACSRTTILALLVIAVMVPCAFANSPKKAATVVVPVLYITDRNLDGETYGKLRRYPTHCQHHMYYGTASVGIPYKDDGDEPAGNDVQRLGWQLTNEKPKKITSKDRVDPADPELSKSKFFKRIEKVLDQSGKDELCVFVHGAADGFEDCAQDAAAMAYALKRPIVLYSWPSNPKWRGYFADSCNNEWSQAHFNQFLTDLIELRSRHPLQVIFIAHSMGNRLAIRALPVVYGKNLVSDWELISPDIDADTCRHYLLGYTEFKSKIRLYVSNKDKLLPFSQKLWGGYYRLGEAANPTSSAPAIHGELLERIDFTALDTGLRGHTIPFRLLGSMVDSDKPGPGLDLVPETIVRGNSFARWAGHSDDLGSTSSESAEFCKKVVKTKSLK